MGAGPASRLDDDDLRGSFVTAWVAGATHAELAALFVISTKTVRNWLDDERVQAEAHKEITARANSFVRKIDAELHGRLDKHGKHMTVDELLKIRNAVNDKVETKRVQISGGVQFTAAQLWAAAESDPAALDRVGQAVLTETIPDAEVVPDVEDE